MTTYNKKNTGGTMNIIHAYIMETKSSGGVLRDLKHEDSLIFRLEKK